MKRRRTRAIKIGDVVVGGDVPISVQSMVKVRTNDVSAVACEIRELEKVGCEIVRVAVPDMASAQALGAIKSSVSIPLVADIHFDKALALLAIEEGVDGIRLNPGNIFKKEDVKEIVELAGEREVAIRVGVNSGSLHRRYRSQLNSDNLAALMVESACDYINLLEGMNFHAITVSLKASDVPTTLSAYRMMAKRCNYPFHLGVTAAGPAAYGGVVKSAVGIGILLAEGIGDTIRVSLTASSIEEVTIGCEILAALNLRERRLDLISCPTCGRCEVDLVGLVKEIESRLRPLRKGSSVGKLAVMGCIVNGPGEAREADVGIAGGKGAGVVFKKGKVVGKVKEENLVEALFAEIEKLEAGR